MNVAVTSRTFRLREPLRAAWGELSEREVLVLSIRGADGVTGFGECAPLEPYDGVSLETARDALEACAAILRAADGSGGSELLDRCRDAAAEVPHALAAIDMALWDRAARREGRPVAELLAGEPLAKVPVNAVVGAVEPGAAAAAAAAAVDEGFDCVKLKVGAGDDARRVAAVRAACGPDVDLRLDANGAWDVETAVAAIEALSPAGLELVEEPVHGIDALRAVRERVMVRVAMDETAATPGAIGSGAADAVCLKVGRAGGISALLAQATLVRSTRAEVYIASALDGPIGIAAALHCAAALRCSIPCGLATLGLFEGDFPELAPKEGVVALPSGPGLLRA